MGVIAIDDVRGLLLAWYGMNYAMSMYKPHGGGCPWMCSSSVHQSGLLADWTLLPFKKKAYALTV